MFLIDDDLTSLNFMGLVLRKHGGAIHRFSDPSARCATASIWSDVTSPGGIPVFLSDSVTIA